MRALKNDRSSATHTEASYPATTTEREGGPPPPTPEAGTLPRLHEGIPDYETYRYGYPPESGRLFGSGN